MTDFLLAALPVLLAASLAAVVLLRMFSSTQDPREPPLISASIPYIGHIIGMMRGKSNYLVQLSQQSSLPIFTLDILGFKMYIVASVELVQAIQKQPKSFALSPLAAGFSSRVLGISAETLMSSVDGDGGDMVLSADLVGRIRSALLSGPNLDKMNRVMIQSISASFDSLDGSTDKAKLKLANWLRRNVTIATTNSIWGPQNPYKDDSVADAFWQFESNLTAQLLNILPSMLARKGIAGRNKVAKAFENYYRMQGHNKATNMMQNRYETGARFGIGQEDNALYEVGVSIALLINIVPTTFWMLLLVFSSPGLLNDIRKELDSVLTETVDNGLVRYLDMTLLKTNCQLLTSTFQEVLRHRSLGVAARRVMQDTVLNGQWLLKKDSLIQMPVRVFHTDSALWGTDADEFNPRRFMNDEGHKKRRTNPAAFRGFGGGATLCPGRHFATNEVLIVVSMFIMRYEMTPTTGKWSLPKSDSSNLASTIMQPDTDVEVELSLRKGFEDGRWVFELKDSEAILAIVAEDRADPFAGE